MKKLKSCTVVFVLFLTQYCLNSFAFTTRVGVIVPDSLIGEWRESSEGRPVDDSDVIAVQADGRVIEIVRRQVGREGGAIPYPTSCRYRTTGIINAINSRTDPSEFTDHNLIRVSSSLIMGYRGEVGGRPDYLLSYNANNIELVDSVLQDPYCGEFILGERTRISDSPINIVGINKLTPESFERHINNTHFIKLSAASMPEEKKE